MKKLILLLTVSALSTGCTLTKQTQALGMGAVAGGIAGSAIRVNDALNGVGNNADTVTGAYIGAIVAQEAQKSHMTEKEKIAEAYAQGQREARVETGAEFWSEVTYADGSHPNLKKNGSTVRHVQAEPKMIEGVNYGSYYRSN